LISPQSLENQPFDPTNGIFLDQFVAMDEWFEELLTLGKKRNHAEITVVSSEEAQLLVKMR